MAKVTLSLDKEVNDRLKGLTEWNKGGVSGLLVRIAEALTNEEDPQTIRRVGGEVVIESSGSSTSGTKELDTKGENRQYSGSTELEELHSNLDLIYNSPMKQMREGIIANLKSWVIVAEVIRDFQGRKGRAISEEEAVRLAKHVEDFIRSAGEPGEQSAGVRAGNQ